MFLGERIREIRKKRSMSLTELAQKSGVQMATLSRMENAKMTGTLESHIAIARALGVDISQLYKDLDRPQPPPSSSHPIEKQAPEVFTHNEKSSYEILTTNILSKKMMPTLLKVEPGGRTAKEQNVPGAEKFVFVLEGKLTVHLGEQTFPVGKHNTLYFDASMEHFFTNDGTATAKAICVTTPMTL